MRVGVIDLGTNTFKLLIADITHEKVIKPLFHKELGVKLGQGGIHEHYMTQDAFQRGKSAFQQLHQIASDYPVDQFLTIATSALRSSINGNLFVKDLENAFNVAVKVVSGDEEADLIYLGVKQTVEITEETALIMDIGGGSIEFIIANDEKWLWKKSYDLGIARLLEWFHPSDPIRYVEIQKIHEFLDNELDHFLSIAHAYQPETLIGCAGTFQTYRQMLHADYPLVYPLNDDHHSVKIHYHDFKNLHSKLLYSTSMEREKMDGLPSYRVEMIVLASIFVNFILDRLGIFHLYQSDYALKEGALNKFFIE